MALQILQHVPFEGPAAIGSWAVERGRAVHLTPAYASTDWLAPAELDGLVILGGPMGVHDEAELPWLRTEKAYIDQVLATETPVLGVCLGAQLLAAALGASVERAPHREIGWFPVEFTAEARDRAPFDGFPEQLAVMHWHGDRFALPPGCTRIGSSGGCAEQGFLDASGRRLGLQFHLEWDRPTAAALIEHGADELAAGGAFVQSEADILAAEAPFEANRRWMYRLLDGFFGP